MKMAHPHKDDTPTWEILDLEDFDASQRVWKMADDLLTMLGDRAPGHVLCPDCRTPHPCSVHCSYVCGYCGIEFGQYRNNWN